MIRQIKKKFKQYQLQQLFKERRALKLKGDPTLLYKILEELNPDFFKGYQKTSSAKLFTANTNSLGELSNALEKMRGEINPNAKPPTTLFDWGTPKEVFIGEFITIHQDCYVSPEEEISRFKNSVGLFLEALSFSFKKDTGLAGYYNYAYKPFISFLTELTIVLIEDSLAI